MAAGVVAAALVAAVAVLVVIGDGDGDGGRPTGSETRADGRLDGAADGPDDRPDERWTRDLGCGSADATTPACDLAADDDRAYLLAPAGAGRSVVAVEAATGDEAWTVEVEGTGGGLTALDDVLLVGGSGAAGAEQVVALDPATGEQRWTTPGRTGPYGDDGLVLVARTDEAGTATGLAAVSLATGEAAWERDGADADDVTLCDGLVLATQGSELVALELAGGEVRWRAPVGALASVVCRGEAVVVSDGERVWRLGADDGEERWDLPVRGLASVEPVDGAVLVATEGEVVALDDVDGEERWRTEDSAFGGDVYGFFEAGDGRAVVSGPGQLALVDLGDGSVGTSIGLGDGNAGSLSDETILILDGATVGAHDVTTLDRRWDVDVVDGVVALEVGGGRLYVRTDDAVVAYR